MITTDPSRRPDGRAADALRPVSIQTGVLKFAEGSALIEVGDTRVLVAATVENRVPPFKKDSGEGWMTAEYSMLPRATHTRSTREVSQGKPSGRTAEIQRLIGRSMRAAVDLS
ncbi:MAG TPA: ribonuclease PH, partial [Thermoanaerobaculia bacterium]|nr:ribonuclease PH [Thermoanaerobaculia bacterium]